MNALETVCNTLSSQLISHSILDDKKNKSTTKIDFEFSFPLNTTNDESEVLTKNEHPPEPTPSKCQVISTTLENTPLQCHSDFLADFAHFRHELNKMRDRLEISFYFILIRSIKIS